MENSAILHKMDSFMNNSKSLENRKIDEPSTVDNKVQSLAAKCFGIDSEMFSAKIDDFLHHHQESTPLQQTPIDHKIISSPAHDN